MRTVKDTKRKVLALFLMLSVLTVSAVGYFRKNAGVGNGIGTEAYAAVRSGGAFSGTAGLLHVYFLDVGQGACVLAECAGHFLLVDGGNEETADYVREYLTQKGVRLLDYVIATHYDADHLSGVVEVLKKIPCGALLDAGYRADTKIYREFCAVADEKDIAQIHPFQGEDYRLGSADFMIVTTGKYNYETENDNSVGIRLRLGKRSFLICGDASFEAEEDMVGSGILLDSDVYMANHHGSKGASSEAFLRAVSPEAVVISAGYRNDCGHPARAAMERLSKTRAAVYRTDLQGELVAETDGEKIRWNVEPA